MIFGFAILATALLLSMVAAYYSVAGLVAIFSAATIPVIIMGGSLELGKIAATVWLHNNWKRAGWAFKAYLIPAVAFLMILTSMGIFGYLSKAHSDQSLVSGDVTSKIAIYDEKIKTEKENIEANRKALKQMDEGVDQVLGRSTTETGADKAVAMRRSQQKERARLQAEISQSQKSIAELNDARAPIAAEVRKVEAEVGPIKYIAALLYGDNPDDNLLERAVRWMIIMIVLVFDPLALTLILAANKQFEWARQGTGGFVHDEPRYEPDDGPINSQVLEQLRTRASEELPQGKMIDKQELFPDDPIPCYKCGTPLVDAPGIGLFCPNRECDVMDNINGEEPIEFAVNTQEIPSVERPGDYVEPPDDYWEHEAENEIKAAITKWKAANPDDTLKNQRYKFIRGEISQLPWMSLIADTVSGKQSNNGFGTQFPSHAERGDTFVRVDRLPSMVYKYNGKDWMEVDKTVTDSYTYDTAYIDHLIEHIASGEYDPELLSETEREQVAQRLQQNTNT
jgi:hypothetical protein